MSDIKTRNDLLKNDIKRQARITRYVLYKETLVDFKEHFWSFIGAFVGIGLIALCQSHYFPRIENIFLVGTFGASSVLIFAAIQSPLTQPRNFIGGQLISAFIGVTLFKFLPDIIWITAPLAVSLSIVAMQMTKTLHPPGGATALIAVLGTEKVSDFGYYFILFPILSGTLILFIVALVFNNITPNRSYPTDSRLTRIFHRREANQDK